MYFAPGTEIIINATVSEILLHKKTHVATGVKLSDGSIIESKIVISNTNPNHTIMDLLSNHKDNTQIFPSAYINHIAHTGKFQIKFL